MRLPDEPLSPAQKEIMEIVWEKGEVAADRGPTASRGWT